MAAICSNLAATSSLSISTWRGSLAVVDELADEWRNLCADAWNDEPFYHPEWIGAYLRAFAPKAEVLLISVREQDCLQLVLPLIHETCTFAGVPVRKLRAPVNAHPGRFDSVCRAGADESVMRAAWKCLKEMDGWDLLELRDVPEGASAGKLAALAQAEGLSAVKVRERVNPCVPVPTGREAQKGLPRNARLRTKLRQARRELAAQGTLKFTCVQTANRSALERFYELEASGWKGQQKSAISNTAGTRSFYDEIAESAARFGYFALYMLEWNGELLAAHFSLLHGGRCYSPRVAYDERFSRFAPGHLIVEEILKDCAARGIRIFDITGPDDEWKMKWTSEVRSVHSYYIFKGALGHLARTVRFGIRPAVGRFLLRKGKSA